MVLPVSAGACANIVSNSIAPVRAKTAKIPSENPKSPTRLTRNALIAAAFASGFLVPEPDEQIAHQPHTFPAEEQLHEVVRGHQHQHRESEQGQIGKETRAVWISSMYPME